MSKGLITLRNHCPMAGKIIGSVVIARRGRRFVMVRHKTRAWEFPGGGILKGESELDAARRELKEETGLIGTNWKHLGEVKGFLALFSCDASGDLRPTAEEIAEAGLFSAPPITLSFPRTEAFEFLRLAGKKQKIRVDYDQAAEYFDDVRTARPEHLDVWLRNIIRWGRIDAGSKVADIGCGTGRYSLGISKLGAGVIGLDASSGMLAKACAKKKGIWAHADASALPVTDETFDTAVLMLVLQHVDDEPLALAEAFRILKSGGRLVIVTVSNGRIRRHIMRHFPGMVSTDLDRFIPVPELKRHLAEVGFTGIRSHRALTKGPDSNVDDVIRQFRRRYISTLVLLPKDEFERGLAVFEKKVRTLYGNRVENTIDMTFIEATRP